METNKRRSVAPYYAVALLWVCCGAMAPLYRISHYLVLGLFSAVIFWAVNRFCSRGGTLGAETAQTTASKTAQTAQATQTAQKSETKAAESKAREDASTGDPALDKMLKDGRLAIAEMKRLDDNIADVGISADIVRLEEVSAKIFEEVKRDPKKLPQIRRFMDYYLPTTLKLLNSYDRMSTAGVSGENIDSTLNKVEGMMRNIVAAFEKQLDSLYGAEAMDISADITVLETMMAREGLTGTPLNNSSGGGSSGGIKLEL